MIREEKLKRLIPNEPKITTGQVVATPTASPPRQLGLTQRPRKGSGNAGAFPFLPTPRRRAGCSDSRLRRDVLCAAHSFVHCVPVT